jgi:leader peptidase (prepilin peptidase) / N-methyltransferase
VNSLLTALAVGPGLALGSFLTVVVARVPKRQSLVRPGSACRSCGVPIQWRDNVPVVSYLWLRGRCRGCATPIGHIYPLLEMATAAFVVACVFVYGPSVRAGASAFFGVVLIAISGIDIQHRIVPNRIVLPATAIMLAAQTIRDPSPRWAAAALAASGFLFAAALAYPRGMGMGGVKLALLLGAGLGPSVAVALLLGMGAALIPSIGLLVRFGAKARKMAIPFAPFLTLGAIFALFFGEAIIRWYLHLTLH